MIMSEYDTKNKEGRDGTKQKSIRNIFNQQKSGQE